MYLHVLTFPFHTLCSISHTSGQDHIFRGLFSRIPPIKPDRRSLSCLLPELPASLCLCPAAASGHLLIFSELNSGFLVTLSSLQYLSHQSIFFFFFSFSINLSSKLLSYNSHYVTLLQSSPYKNILSSFGAYHALGYSYLTT